MHLKTLVSAAITFVGVTLAIGYFGFSTSVSGLLAAKAHDPIATSSLAIGFFPKIADSGVQPAPPSKPLPPADPDKPSVELPSIVFPKIPLPTETPIAPSPSVAPVTPITPPPVSRPLTPVPETPSAPVVTNTSSNSAFVNIVCSPNRGPLQKSISGSGTIITASGIILTVAHVGHYFLLENYPVANNADCVVRTGSPAKTAYDAKLVYVSPEWVKENGGALAEAAPRGNGENDFALLAITSSLTSAKLPSSFPYVSLSSASSDVGDSVTIGTYGAEFLTGSQIRSALYPTMVSGSIASVYTFGAKKEVDVISVKGSEAAQSGSSGGGITNNGRYIGLITTSSLVGDVSQRTLYAITPTHIRVSFKSDTGKDLDSYLKGSPSTLVSDFSDEIPDLAKIVWDKLF